MADVEKTDELRHVESAAPQGYRYVQVDEAVEKRVVRKLDLNLMPLVVVLCKSDNASVTMMTTDDSSEIYRSSLLSGPLQHWKCSDCRT
jgi:hypothetical protein